jgi:hypothetical protein
MFRSESSLQASALSHTWAHVQLLILVVSLIFLGNMTRLFWKSEFRINHVSYFTFMLYPWIQGYWMAG